MSETCLYDDQLSYGYFPPI